MKTYSNETEAETAMRSANRARRAVRNYSMTVLVDGPGENEWTVMELVEAIADEFFYRWAAPAGPLTSRLRTRQRQSKCRLFQQPASRRNWGSPIS